MNEPMLPVGHAQTIVATVSGDDLLKALNGLTVQVAEVKVIVQDLPGRVDDLGKRISKLELWKSKMMGGTAVITLLLTGGTVASLIAVFTHVVSSK